MSAGNQAAPKGHRYSWLFLTATSQRGTQLSLTFLCFLAIHLSQLLSISSHLDSRCRSTSKGTSSSLWDREEEAGQWVPDLL